MLWVQNPEQGKARYVWVSDIDGDNPQQFGEKSP